MNEAKLTRKILKSLKDTYGGIWWKIHANVYQGKGTLDIFGVTEGKFFGLEVKLPGKEDTLSKMQEYTIKKINESGGYSRMVTSVKQTTRFVKRALNQ